MGPAVAIPVVAARHHIARYRVKGHTGHRENDLADAMANRSIDELED